MALDKQFRARLTDDLGVKDVVEEPNCSRDDDARPSSTTAERKEKEEEEEEEATS